MRIALDAMGGDYAPKNIVERAVLTKPTRISSWILLKWADEAGHSTGACIQVHDGE